MAALLVIAVAVLCRLLAPCPAKKIHPFYLHRYFCVTTLVSRRRWVPLRDSGGGKSIKRKLDSRADNRLDYPEPVEGRERPVLS
jgi:hypothetical protein